MWHLYGLIMAQLGNSNHLIVTLVSTLTISNVTYSDIGSYMCIVRGSLSARSNSATITVNGKFNLHIINYFIDHYYV